MKKILFLAAIAVFALQGCKDDEKIDTPTPTGGNATAVFKIDHVAEDHHDMLMLNKDYTLSDGSKVSIDFVRYWLSNVEFVKDDGSVWKESASYRLIEQTAQNNRREFQLNMPSGKYKAVRFSIGVDANRNSSTDSISGELDVTKGMNWNWNTGYIFMKLEGKYTDKDTTGSINWRYHLGMNANYKTIEMAFPSAVEFGSNKKVELELMYHVLDIFSTPNQMSLKQFPTLMVGPADQTARAAENYSKAFHLHGVKKVD